MAASQPATHERVLEEQLEKNTVLIVGGGPAGLVLATTLAYFGVKSVVLERNDTTTRYQPTSRSTKDL
jgi:2-polyprenyl-6-methoxyphenol hydroxylase-like FAD-dependent oxidoreductase